MFKEKLTQERLKELLLYDPSTGFFVWTKNRRGSTAGNQAGCIGRGYIVIGVDSKLYSGHRLAWLYTHGYFPENQIDHINRNKADNRIDNLREISQSCNTRNTPNRVDNSSGVKGVYFHKIMNKWTAEIMVNGNKNRLGYYVSFDDAVRARLASEKKLGWDICDSNSPAYQYLKQKQIYAI